MSETARLTRGSIPGHLLTQTLPMVIGVAALLSIGLVDAYFIGRIGSDALAAISFIFPITVALTSLGVGVMVGINSVVARSLGKGDTEEAARRANFGIAFALACGIAIGAALYLLENPLFRLMNADDAILPLIRDYMRPFALGFPLLLLMMGFNGTLRGQGEARKTSYMAVTYAALNWVLDPMLIEGWWGSPAFGIAGAAYATIIGWLAALALGLVLMRATPLPFAPRLLLRGDLRDPLRAIVRVAGPAAFSNAINPIGLSVLTALIAVEGQSAVAAFGSAGRLQSFALVPLLALSGSIGAIVGQNWGADQPHRARRAAFYAGGFCVAYGLATAVVLFAFGNRVAHLFTGDPVVIDQFARYLAIAAWGYAGYGLLIVGNGVLNAVDRAGLALAQSCARVFLVMMPFAWLLRSSWGSDAIYAGELAANLAGGAVASAIVWYVLRERPDPRFHGEAGEAATATG